MLKVVHLQTGLPTSGNAAFRLHEAMLANNIQSTILAYNTSRPVSKRINTFKGLNKLIKERLYRMLLNFVETRKKADTYLFSFPVLIGNNVSRHPLIKNADVIYLHWIVGGFLSLNNIKQLLTLGKPIVFFMHDMWTITGGCHHSFECRNYETGCEYCPMFKRGNKTTFASKEFNIKKALFSKHKNVHFISPSKWLADAAFKSGLTRDKNIFHIPNIIDEHFFKPFNKKTAKEILNLSTNSKTITFGCLAGTNNKFKGWQYLEKALNFLYKANKTNNIEILIFGSEYDKATVDAVPYPIKFLGKINDDMSMVIINNATDVFVSPSLAESFGLSFLENVMCGTPVVGFNVGGVPEIIEHKINGYLANYKSAEDLAEGIIYCLNNTLPMPKSRHYYKEVIIQKHKDFLQEVLL
jgi:glycosyltransferase involved in cell wall biosynthesis